MDRDSIYRVVLDVSIQLNRLLANMRETDDQEQLVGSRTTLELLLERRRAALERYRSNFEKMQRSEQDKIRAYHNQRNSGDASEDGVDEIDSQSQH